MGTFPRQPSRNEPGLEEIGRSFSDWRQACSPYTPCPESIPEACSILQGVYSCSSSPLLSSYLCACVCVCEAESQSNPELSSMTSFTNYPDLGIPSLPLKTRIAGLPTTWHLHTSQGSELQSPCLQGKCCTPNHLSSPLALFYLSACVCMSWASGCLLCGGQRTILSAYLL